MINKQISEYNATTTYIKGHVVWGADDIAYIFDPLMNTDWKVFKRIKTLHQDGRGNKVYLYEKRINNDNRY